MGAERFHPIEFIDEELEARGWTRRDLAERMGGDADVNECALDLYSVRDPMVFMGDETANGIGRAFGTSAALWLRLEASWRKP